LLSPSHDEFRHRDGVENRISIVGAPVARLPNVLVIDENDDVLDGNADVIGLEE
jgi:hypothetical protein